VTDTGLLALVGGGEWRRRASFDVELLERSGADEVLVLPTAAAYERPERALATAERYFAALGVPVRGLMVLRHAEADEPANAEVVRRARFVYLSGGSPLHLRSVLQGSLVFDALLAAWRAGASVAGSSAGAMVLGDPMVDPRGGAFTVGLGMVEQLAVLPHFVPGEEAHHWRTFDLAPRGVFLLGVPEGSAAVREPDGSWRSSGDVEVAAFRDGVRVGLEALRDAERSAGR
jgi:cyanophycinase